MGSAQAKDAVVGELDIKNSTPKVQAKKEKAPQQEVSPNPQPAEKKPVEEGEKKVVAGYKPGGFFIQSADEKYKLVIGAYVQFQFDFNRTGGENEYGFLIRRARLAFSGNLFTKKFTYKFQFDFAKFKTELLLDAYVNYEILSGQKLEVRAGQFTIPYIRQHQISSSAQMFVDRSLASRVFIMADDVDSDGDGVPDKLVNNGRDLGVMLHGKPFEKKMEYQVGIFNGHGTNTLNVNNDFLYMGRMVWNVKGDAGYKYESDFEFSKSPAVFIGGSGNYNVRNISKDQVVSAGAEAGLKYKGFSATGEFFFRNTQPGDTLLSTTNDYGYYLQGGYFIIPKRFEVAARASQVFLQGFQNDQGEYMFGMNGYIFEDRLKFQGDYSYVPEVTKDGVENNQRFRLRLQTKF